MRAMREVMNMKIEVTLEKTQRVCLEFDATKEQLDMLRNGDNPFQAELEKELVNGDEHYDYAVNDMEGREIVPFSGY